MGSPSDDAPERVELGKHADPSDQPGEQSARQAADQAAEAPFDPYRFGAPDVPPPPEYAPPGYTPPPGYQYPPRAESPHGAYPPYPYGTTAGGPGAGGYPQAPSGQAPYGQTPYGQSPYGQAPYGQAPYGQAPYGPGRHTGTGSGGSGKAVAALVLGILSIVFFWTTFLDAAFVLLAVIFGSLGLGDARRHGRGRGQALAGLICAGVGAVLAVLFTVLVVHLANKCGGLDNQGSPGYNRCLRDHLS